ncbi:MAG: VCBS repeat-containing protein [Verrucomicrobia bacterium]|nr:VCBS repeat-containing protein [Verrucomicrobiota bacterium]
MKSCSQELLAAYWRQLRASLVIGWILWTCFFQIVFSEDLDSVGSYSNRSLSVQADSPNSQPGFTPMPSNTVGIVWRNDLLPADAEQNRILENGSGVAAGDVNGDGFCDLYFATIEGSNHLHLNNGDWTCREVELASGARCAGQASTGVLLADVEGDGDLDLLVNGVGTGTRLFINDGKGLFSERIQSGLTHKGGAMSMAMADADQDGDLDLYVAYYRENTWKDLPLGVNPRVIQKGNRPHALPEDRFVAIYTGPGIKPGITEVGEPDQFYLNNGDGTFVHQPWLGGSFRDEDGQVLESIPRHWGLSVLFRDLNGDLLPDLLVCNDFAYGEDQIWMNQGGAVFHQLSNKAMRQSSWSSMAADVADINRDGHDDLFIVEMLSRQHAKRQTQRANYETGIEAPAIAMGLDRPQTQRNTLFLNRGDGTYAEIGRMAGLDASEWSWGTVFLDVDLDGWEDVLVANGNNHDLLDGDATIAAVIAMRSATRGQIPQTLLMYPSLHTPNLAFRNRGDLTFEEISETWGFNEVGISQGICLADLDRDGDLDVVVNNLQGTPSLYRNNTIRPRMSVRLQSQGRNPRGIGARLRLALPGSTEIPQQTKSMTTGGRYLSSDDNVIVFATFEEGGEMRLEVDWPSGQSSLIESVQSNREYLIREPVLNVDTHPNESKASTFKPLFEAVSTAQFDKKHLETQSPGAMNTQPLLPRYFDRWGPSIVVGDLNGDGTRDLVTGHGHSHRASFIAGLADGNLGENVIELIKTGDGDQTDIVAWKEADGRMRLAVSVSNYTKAVQSGLEAIKSQSSVLIYKEQDDQFQLVQSLPGQRALPGCLELLDYDGDGDQDLFVGGRMNPGRYPEPAISRLYENENGFFKLNLDQSRAWFDLGLVTDAKSLDRDGDGDQDLLIAREWNTLVFWDNQDGVFIDKTQDVGLATRKGLWTALAVADLDGDGDMDAVAGNWGRNTDYQKHLHHPIRMYHGDLDRNGRYDLVESYYDPESDAWVPSRDLIVLGNAFPFIRERYRSYLGMSKTKVDELFQSVSQLGDWLEIDFLDTGILWNEEGQFRWQSLPLEAQLTPAMSIAVSDFNGDGQTDIFIGQNTQSLQPEISRFDAGLGLVLLAEGGQRFKALTAEESGIRIFGEQTEAVATDWDGDGRVDLLVGQTAGELRLYLQSKQSSLSIDLSK